MDAAKNDSLQPYELARPTHLHRCCWRWRRLSLCHGLAQSVQEANWVAWCRLSNNWWSQTSGHLPHNKAHRQEQLRGTDIIYNVYILTWYLSRMPGRTIECKAVQKGTSPRTAERNRHHIQLVELRPSHIVTNALAQFVWALPFPASRRVGWAARRNSCCTSSHTRSAPCQACRLHMNLPPMAPFCCHNSLKP